MNPAYLRAFGFVLLLACTAPTPALAEGPRVTMTMVMDVQGDLPGFLEVHRKIEAVRKSLELTSTSRVMHATIAGAETQRIAVAIDYPDLATLGQEMPKLYSNPEFRQITRENMGKFRLLSRSVWTEIAPE